MSKKQDQAQSTLIEEYKKLDDLCEAILKKKRKRNTKGK